MKKNKPMRAVDLEKNEIIETALLKNVGGGGYPILPGQPGFPGQLCNPNCQPACGCGPDICNPQGDFCISTPP
ncbi:hypothetical protein JK628_22585 [Shewanella sp. KX20019]|uniref:hypothetical protein n=1 Tax=Shewanella sp. KX20019 TaxID=2803864 RepID=UPI001928996B|nr:hypothetical protein [Shewanella sp. KX20019]QQX80218.1 hypothetical protein JK628_22585 [Shewanella sp. KX20019]